MSSTSPENETDQHGLSALEREEAARYIAALTAELSSISRRADLGLLTYFLEMARMEAQEIALDERKAKRKADPGG